MKSFLIILFTFMYHLGAAQTKVTSAEFKFLQKKITQVQGQLQYLKGEPHLRLNMATLKFESPEVLTISYFRTNAKGRNDTVTHRFYPKDIKNITMGKRFNNQTSQLYIESAERNVELIYRSDLKEANSKGNLSHVFAVYYFDENNSLFEKMKKCFLSLKSPL